MKDFSLCHALPRRNLSTLAASPRPYRGLPDFDYPFHDKIVAVTNCGRICLGRKKMNFSTVFAGHTVGLKEVHDDIWVVSFMDMVWNTSIWKRAFSNRSRTRSALNYYPCDRYTLLPMSPGWNPRRHGEPGRTRTFDPRLKRALLYHLSYWPMPCKLLIRMTL